MKFSIRKKIILAFILLILVSGPMWFLGYYQYYILNQKLRILEKKDNLLNIILEARRYEKNYFISLDAKHLENAVAYVRQGEQKLCQIIEDYSRFVLARDLEEKLDELRRYDNALVNLLSLYHEGGSLKTNKNVIEKFSQHKEEVRNLGRKITVDMESMITKERKHIKQLIGKSKIYLFMALAAIFVMSFLTTLFLIFNVNRPLKSIEDAIYKIAEGDYKNIPSISTGDEFESLVTSLNNMIYELNKRSEQLLQSEKLASLGTLTSGVAHELNNPLNNISTSIQILLEELEDADVKYQKELLTETQKQVDRARDIVKALLEFSRERSFSLKQIHFKDLVDSTIKLIKGELPADVELRVDVPEQIQGDMDPRRIQQVLLNLILNGIQAMEDGGVLTIKAYEQKEKNEFCFQVQDTGQGIPEENLSKIFDPFFTTKDVSRGSELEPSVSHGIVEQKGSGLGLSICHAIVEQHGGRIEVDSKWGEGTTFTIHLPLGREDGGTA
ncbi:MAG: HAMP domain-containing protein [Deltaproteobacteria bacterium]|nr:HAMP domain-containing protein [Deltaproteobacteria bacterium]MBW2073767.1 HAMP domain-containing protein [Deltaproteobacteria bacterium]